MSNILSVFNPPPSRDIPDEPCLPCTAIQSLMSFAGGLYLNLNSLFKDLKGKINVHKNPIWWQNSCQVAWYLVDRSRGLQGWRSGPYGVVLVNGTDLVELSDSSCLESYLQSPPHIYPCCIYICIHQFHLILRYIAGYSTIFTTIYVPNPGHIYLCPHRKSLHR